MTDNPFNTVYAKNYDYFYNELDTDSDITFITDSLLRFRGPGKQRILDIGCGTGRHAIPLAGLGHHVHGIDVSEAMILVARSKPSGAKFEVKDIRDYFTFRKFSACIMMFNVVGYMLTDEDVSHTFSSIWSALTRKGILVMDFWNKEQVLRFPPVYKERTWETPTGLVSRKSIPRILTGDRLSIEYVVTSPEAIDGSSHEVRYFYPEDLVYVAEKYDLRLKALYKEPEGSPIWTCKMVLQKA